MMNNFPLVSVIIPLYNAERYIDKAIASVLNQTYKNIEIVIVDDGSVDDGYAVASGYKSNVLKLFRQKNKGACAARNYGIKKSSGEYIQFLDADDLLSADKINNQITKLTGIKKGYVANCKWGRFFKSTDTVQWENQYINKNYNDPNQWLADSWSGKGMAQTAVWLTPRKLIEQVGPWNEELQLNQDGEFFCRVLLKSKGITFVNDCGVYYRSGLSNSISKKNNYGREKAESQLGSYQLYKQHIGEHHAQSSLKKALGNIFLMFMYQYHSHFPDLSKIAEKEFFELGNIRMWPVGGKRFQHLAKIMGFKNALKLKSIV